jgi:uncharacterized RDD family membrane protein YckC
LRAHYASDTPPMPTPLHTTDIPCPLWRRLLALVYDALIVLALVMVVGLLCQLATHGTLITTGPAISVPAWYQILQGVVIAAYFVSAWRRGGQTVGMRPWRMRVTTMAGATPSLPQSVIRLLAAAAPLLLLPFEPALGLHDTLYALTFAWAAWFAVALVDPRRRALHDLAAGTEIRLLG